MHPRIQQLQLFSRCLVAVAAFLVAAAPVAAQDQAAEIQPPPGEPGEILPAGPDSGTDAMAAEEVPTLGEPPSATQAELRDRLAEIARAIDRYRKTGEAAVIKRSAIEIFPYGESQPVVRCSLFVVCDIELEPGEIITDVALGAPRLWEAREMVSGDPGEPTPHVIVWPLDYDLVTNAIIATTRRTYHLGLVSPPRDEIAGGQTPYHRHISFYYPAETVRRWHTLEEVRKEQAARRASEREAAVSIAVGGLDLEQLDLAYDLKADRRVTWAPDLVFDNGRQVFLHFPSHVRSTNFPTLLVESPEGSLGVANFRVSPDGRWMIFDGVFRRARLVSGTGRSQRKVEIVKGG